MDSAELTNKIWRSQVECYPYRVTSCFPLSERVRWFPIHRETENQFHIATDDVRILPLSIAFPFDNLDGCVLFQDHCAFVALMKSISTATSSYLGSRKGNAGPADKWLSLGLYLTVQHTWANPLTTIEIILSRQKADHKTLWTVRESNSPKNETISPVVLSKKAFRDKYAHD